MRYDERMTNTLDELIGYRHGLTAVCDPCGSYRVLDLQALAARLGGATSVDALRERLSCSKCGRRAPGLLLTTAGMWDGASAHRG